MFMVDLFLNNICKRDVDEVDIPKSCTGKGLGCNRPRKVVKSCIIRLS